MIPQAPVNTPRQSVKAQVIKRHETLKKERAPWVAVWTQQADYIMPRRFRDSTSQRNRPQPNEKLINNTPTQAARTLASGLMSGLTSPARPWFRLSIPGAQQTFAVKEWLSQVENIIREVLIRSNLYNSLAHIFGDLGTFCTAAMLVEEDDKDVVRGYVLPLGSFVLTTSARGQVDGLIRDYPMTVGQVVEQFGLEACSRRVRESFGRGDYDAVVDVTHAIEPNPHYVPDQLGVRGMKWRSLWFETKEDVSKDTFLRVAGFNEFPLMAPRWNVTGTDTYGTGPGFDALGDAKALQLLEKRKAMIVDRITNPPMVAPTALRAGRPSLMPGDVVFVDKIAGSQGFEPAMMINPAAIGAVDAVIRAHEDRINTSFYADLWLALTMDERKQRATAREVAERHEEKLLALGPTLERLHDELLDKLLERVFAICMRRGLFPKPPRELQGQDVRIEYISVMAVAQRLLGVSAVERLVSFVGNLAAAKPESLDKLNTDKIIDDYADMLGTAPGMLLTDEQVTELRNARAEAAAAQREQEMAAQQGPDMAKSAELLSRTDVGGTSALQRLLSTQAGSGPLR